MHGESRFLNNLWLSIPTDYFIFQDGRLGSGLSCIAANYIKGDNGTNNTILLPSRKK
jgi:hypothetical protein